MQIPAVIITQRFVTVIRPLILAILGLQKPRNPVPLILHPVN